MEKESNFAIFVYEKQDQDLIDQLSTYLDSKAKNICMFFDVNTPFKNPTIKIIPTKEEYDNIWRQSLGFPADYDVPKWSVGFSKNLHITYLSLHDYKNTSHSFEEDDFLLALDHYKKTLVHEYVHFVNELFNIKNNCGFTAKYLREGIATYLSGQKENKQLNFNFTLDQLLQQDVKQSCYAGWFLVTKYLVENYDRPFVLQLFQSNRQATEFLNNELFEKSKNFYNQKNMQPA